MIKFKYIYIIYQKRNTFKKMETAVSWKEKGNKFVQERQYAEALNCYSKAIELDANDPILYSNRSAMYYNLNYFDNAIIDAEMAITLRPTYAKAYLRKGNALEGLKKYKEALDSYEAGLKQDPDNEQLIEAQKKLKELMEKPNDNIINEQNGKDMNLIEKYALKKNVRIYLDKKIGNNVVLCGNIEEVNEGLIYFKDDKNVFHILNCKNILDIEMI